MTESNTISIRFNKDALVIIMNALLWTAHDTRLPQEERNWAKAIADQFSTVEVEATPEEVALPVAPISPLWTPEGN